ncbi:unnamed protein product [Penicillium viridicatum]
MDSSPTPVVLITAGSAGLSAATARLFAQHGYRVVVKYITNAQRAGILCAELGGGGHVAIQADLGSRNYVERLVHKAHAQMNRLDVVFSNGGWTRFSVTTSLDDNAVNADWDRAFAINAKSRIWLLQAARLHLDKTEGAFVTTSSIAGVQGMGSSLVCFLDPQMVRCRTTTTRIRIRVNSMSPGLLQTEWAERFSKEQKEAHRQKAKLKRFVAVEDVAAQVLSLATSKSMTGANIIVDAGYTL